MTALDDAQWLAAVRIDDEVSALQPGYRALVMTVSGLAGGPTDAGSDALLAAAEARAAELAADAAVDALPHVTQWREAYRSFGAKPQRTRPSVEALLRRCPDGLPRIDRITDVYNAVSVAHVVPIGGEDLSAYAGPARLVRARGDEPFEATAQGQPVIEHPDAGEVVWRDDAGVTCRRWNWRQCTRTRITEGTTRAVFILDGLPALGTDGLAAAADTLEAGLRAISPDAAILRRVVGPA